MMCAGAIEKAVSAIDGVTAVSVNLGAEKAQVTYRAGLVFPSDIRKAIEDAGYHYLGIEGEDTEQHGGARPRKGPAGKA